MNEESYTLETIDNDYRNFVMNEINSLPHEALKTYAVDLFDKYHNRLSFLDNLFARAYKLQDGELAAYLGITENLKSNEPENRASFYLEVARKALALVQVDKEAMLQLAKEDPGAYAQMLIRRRLAAENKIVGHYVSNQLLSVILNGSVTPYNEYVDNRQEAKQLWNQDWAPRSSRPTGEKNMHQNREYTDWFLFVESFNLYDTPQRVSVTFGKYSQQSDASYESQ